MKNPGGYHLSHTDGTGVLDRWCSPIRLAGTPSAQAARFAAMQRGPLSHHMAAPAVFDGAPLTSAETVHGDRKVTATN